MDDQDQLMQYLKENPELHQKMLDQKIQQGSVFDKQAQNPAVQQEYKEAAIESDPREKLKRDLMTNKLDPQVQEMMEGMAMGGVGTVGKVLAREAAPVAKSFGKVIMNEAVPAIKEGASKFGNVIMKAAPEAEGFGNVAMKQPGENYAQAYQRLQEMVKRGLK